MTQVCSDISRSPTSRSTTDYFSGNGVYAGKRFQAINVRASTGAWRAGGVCPLGNGRCQPIKAPGYGTAGGGGPANSYAANTGKGNAIQCFEAVGPGLPIHTQTEWRHATFVFKDQNGGSAVVGAKVYLREHYSQQLIGPIRVTDATGTVVYRNLDNLWCLLHHIFTTSNKHWIYPARADWIRANLS